MRPTVMKRLLIALLITAPAWADLASAACAAPFLESPRPVPVGSPLEITGHGWADGCNDQGESSGCGSSEEEEATPITDVRVVLRMGTEVIETTTVDGPRFTVSFDTRGLDPGNYTVIATAGHAGDQIPVKITNDP